MTFQTIGDIIDLERYPLHDLGSAKVDKLLRQGREALAGDALFSLQGFVRPEATDFMALI